MAIENERIKKTICLNMIVKNESSIIYNSLVNLTNKIKFDYWVISDTGSTDNTIEIIQNFFKEKGIPGEIHEDQWKDFGFNRSKALEYAYNKTDYLLVFDADDEIIGDFKLPEVFELDAYHVYFGNTHFKYLRLALVNNRKKWKYVGVLHEYIHALETCTRGQIEGDYFFVSGRSGARNQNVNKYYDDAIILKNAFYEEDKNGDKGLAARYSFYCAQSFKDAGDQYMDDAIEWYKKTLELNNWAQEKYYSCLMVGDIYKKKNDIENACNYWLKTIQYDNERIEGIVNVMSEYRSLNKHLLVNALYYKFKNYKKDFKDKLFLFNYKYNDEIEYNNSICSYYVNDFQSGYECCKKILINNLLPLNIIENTMSNLIFYKENMFKSEDTLDLFYSIEKLLLEIEKTKNINNEFINIRNELFKKNKDVLIKQNISENFKSLKNPNDCEKKSDFTKNECKNCNNILFYTGFSGEPWNYTYGTTNALGGSERAVAYLTKCLPKNYNIYVSGGVKNEKLDNVTYVQLCDLENLLKTTPFHTIIISRYISFLEMFSHVMKFHQIFIWAHDTCLIHYGCNLSSAQIVEKWNQTIDGCICLTEWHKELYIKEYPLLKDKIHIINNGIQSDLFTIKPIKQNNKFIYTSCSERGLNVLLDLWPQILEKLPDAELIISSYNKFPKNEEENNFKKIIDNYESIKHVGKLNSNELYEHMSTSEYWLYPTSWSETSCITALEMLASEVICVYYPLAGLINTLDDYGIKVKKGEEINTIVNLTDEQKNEIRRKGKEYVNSCSWDKRSEIWNKNIINHGSFISPVYVNFLENLNTEFNLKPKVIYDITNSSNLGWLNVANNIWKDSEIFLFDIENVIIDNELTFNKFLQINFFPFPDLVKIDLQEDGLNIIKRGMDVINNSKHLIVKTSKLENNVIDYLQNTGWELISKSPLENSDGIEENYCFKNTKKVWVFIISEYCYLNIFDDYLDSLRHKYNIRIFKSNDNDDVIINLNPYKVTFIMYIYKKDICKKLNDDVEIGILNTEPLNNIIRFQDIMSNMASIPSMKIYDYSTSNIQILNNKGQTNTQFLPYNIYDIENDFLINLRKNTEIKYDFGIISHDPITCVRRKIVVDYLISQGYKLSIIDGWKEKRDKEIAECNIILNIHGYYNQVSEIFEHIRCDRLLSAGFKILSEESLNLDNKFIEQYPNLKLIKYDDFTNKEIYSDKWFEFKI